jgi:hypothetical protein
MLIRKTLGTIILASTIALAGCGTPNPEYDFDGIIEKEHIKFSENLFGSNFLKVKKPDGSEIEYVDLDDDFKLDYVEIRVGENKTVYYAGSSNLDVTPIVQKSQKQFENYLKKITEIQTKPLREE